MQNKLICALNLACHATGLTHNKDYTIAATFLCRTGVGAFLTCLFGIRDIHVQGENLQKANMDFEICLIFM